MKTTAIIALLALAPCLTTQAQDIRDKVTKTSPNKTAHTLIHPNHSLLGHKIGTPEDELFEKLGEPTAYIRLAPDNTAAVYSDKAFIFTKGKLSGIHISHHIIDHTLKEAFGGPIFYKPFKWKLNNGIQHDSSLADIKKILGDKLKPKRPHSKYTQTYTDGDSEITLQFSHMSNRGEGDSSYHLHAILVKPKN